MATVKQVSNPVSWVGDPLSNGGQFYPPRYDQYGSPYPPAGTPGMIPSPSRAPQQDPHVAVLMQIMLGQVGKLATAITDLSEQVERLVTEVSILNNKGDQNEEIPF